MARCSGRCTEPADPCPSNVEPCSYFSEDLIDEIANNPKVRLPALVWNSTGQGGRTAFQRGWRRLLL